MDTIRAALEAVHGPQVAAVASSSAATSGSPRPRRRVRAPGAIIHHGKGVDEAMQIGALRN